MLSQFSRIGDKRSLADFIDEPGVYAAGRLDYDSEGLMILTDDGALQARISSPRHKLEKIYWVQVEGAIHAETLARLRRGIDLRDGPARASLADIIAEPCLWPRHPPIRQRASIPTSWIRLGLREGRNRQIRRMTAAVGHPTLRLIRAAIGPISLGELTPGQSRLIDLTTELPELLPARRAPAAPGLPPRRRRPRRPSSRG